MNFPAPGPGKSPETVVLVHGILNRPFMMALIARALRKSGYRVINWGYASTQESIEAHADRLERDLAAQLFEAPVHFVGFSLGAIVLRYFLARRPPAGAGRLVQIAPPNRGSLWVDTLLVFRLFRWIFGDKTIQQLKADHPFFKTCGTPRIPFGILYGGLGNNRGFNPVFGRDNDGSIDADSARLPGAADVVRVKAPHTLLLFKKETARHVIHFLKTGRFIRTNDTGGFPCSSS